MFLIFQVEVVYEAQTLNNNKMLMLSRKIFPHPVATKNQKLEDTPKQNGLQAMFPCHFNWRLLPQSQPWSMSSIALRDVKALRCFLLADFYQATIDRFFFAATFFGGGIFPKKQPKVVFFTCYVNTTHQIWMKKYGDESSLMNGTVELMRNG